MSSTEEVSESSSLVIHNKDYVIDEELNIIPSGWDSQDKPQDLNHPPLSVFPSLKTFVHVAKVAYSTHKEEITRKCPSADELKKDGFTFLSAANNPATRNGYYGVAYVNRETRQIILGHRGTVLTTFGALFADGKGIGLSKFVPQVSSAMTFAHRVVFFAEKLGFQVFFTGHSLGAWLAQITTFSAMYLTLDEATRHFIAKQSPHLNVRMPYTVVFDSPGAYNFLFKLKKALFPRHVESSQEIHVETLPVEVFLFHPNPVNRVNFQIGKVFILAVEKVGVDTNKFFGATTHGIGPVVELLNEFGEADAVKWRVIDFREGNKDFSANSKDVRERTVQWDRSSVPLYFFSREERKFLEGAKRDFSPEGQFEGVNWVDEDIANDLLTRLKDGEFMWRLTGADNSVVTCEGRDRREFIPRVRHTIRCLRHRGTLWWNPRRSQLPSSYIDRRIRPTATTHSEEKALSGSAILEEPQGLVLFVDPPGMGKSSAMTKLEMQLRVEIASSPRVIVRLNLNHVQDILQSQGSNAETPDESYNSICFIEAFLQNIPVTLLQQTFPGGSLPLYVLLDGLDEVCPEYGQVMMCILHSLLSDTPQGLFCVHKVILTTRPHLKNLIEYQFHVQGNSLLPLEIKEQVEFLQRETSLSFDVEKSLKSLPDAARSLMENPLMLSLYAGVLKSHGTETVLDLFDLYSQFVNAKHELHLVEKEEADPAKMTTRRRVKCMLNDNLKLYFTCAVGEVVGALKPEAISNNRRVCDSWEALLELPSYTKLDELISYGVVAVGENNVVRFKHRSFAEFFYAQLLTHEAKEYKEVRDVLFGRMYENNAAENVGRFVQSILLRRQKERSKYTDSFPLTWLREEEAALYLGKERLQCLANGWFESQEQQWSALERLLREIEKPLDYYNRGSIRISRLEEVRGEELVGSDDKTRALEKFYRGNLFSFLCGRSVLLSLDYSHPDIFESMKYTKTAFELFWRWLHGLRDCSWVRSKVFGIKEQSVVKGDGRHWYGSAVSAEIVLMMVVRTDDIWEFLSHEEISAALNSLHLVVKDSWREEDVEVERIRNTLNKYVHPQKLKHSLLNHSRIADSFLQKQMRGLQFQRQARDFQWSWWLAEEFSRKEVLSFVTDDASRVPDISRIGYRTVRDAWGEEFEPPCESFGPIRWPQVVGKTLMDVSEGDLVFVSCLWEEVERGGLKLEGDLMEVMTEMIFGYSSGWQVLEMLERRVMRYQRTNVNSCSAQETNSVTNILKHLLRPVEVGTRILDTFRPNLLRHSSFKSGRQDINELEDLLGWLPFVVRYSRRIEPVKIITKRIASITEHLKSDTDYFTSAARSLIIAHSSKANGSSSVCQHIHSFIKGLEKKPESLLNVLVDTNEDELRTLIKDLPCGTFPTVTHTLVGPVLTALIYKEKYILEESPLTLSLGLTIETPWNIESVAFIFTEIIHTSACYEVPSALEQFISCFPSDILKAALLSYEVWRCFTSKRRNVEFRKYVFVNTERNCSLRAAIRYCFVVFGEDLQWIEHQTHGIELLRIMLVEILGVLGEEQETSVEGFPPLSIETRLSLLSQVKEKLRNRCARKPCASQSLSGFTKARFFSYETEEDWELLLEAFQLIPHVPCRPIGQRSAVVDHNHAFLSIAECRLCLLRVWVKHFGLEETRKAADEHKLWEWFRDSQAVPMGEYLHAAVEVGSLKGVEVFAWPGLLKWKNKSRKTAEEVAVELWGAHHEISQFLKERFQAVRAFHDDL